MYVGQSFEIRCNSGLPISKTIWQSWEGGRSGQPNARRGGFCCKARLELLGLLSLQFHQSIGGGGVITHPYPCFCWKLWAGSLLNSHHLIVWHLAVLAHLAGGTWKQWSQSIYWKGNHPMQNNWSIKNQGKLWINRCCARNCALAAGNKGQSFGC